MLDLNQRLVPCEETTLPLTPDKPIYATTRSTIRSENASRRAHRGAGEHDAGVQRTGRLAKVAGGAWGLGPRKAPLGARANRGGLLSCRLSLTRRRTPTSRSPAPLHTETSASGGRQQAGARALRAKPGATRRQGRAKRMPRQGGLRVGVGGRCNQTKPRTQFNTPAAKHPRQREPFDSAQHRALVRAPGLVGAAA